MFSFCIPDFNNLRIFCTTSPLPELGLKWIFQTRPMQKYAWASFEKRACSRSLRADFRLRPPSQGKNTCPLWILLPWLKRRNFLNALPSPIPFISTKASDTFYDGVGVISQTNPGWQRHPFFLGPFWPFLTIDSEYYGDACSPETSSINICPSRIHFGAWEKH